MASTASLDSIVFFQDKKRQIRVYYAFSDEKVIRESCHHQDYGWFVRGDGIVTRNSKSNSPITATRWTDNTGITQVRVIYMDDENNICECHGQDPPARLGPWETAIIGSAEETEIATTSQLAVARPDKDDTILRVFYQEESNNDGKSAALRETRYDLKYNTWAVQDNPIIGDALVGTRLAAVSEKGQNEVRLYYQGTDLVLREMYCRKWRWDPNSNRIRRDKLAERAPIAAVCWAPDASDLQIRVFTVLSANTSAIAQFSYSTPNWRVEPALKETYQAGSAISCCRNTASETAAQNPVILLYQPGNRAINFKAFPADESMVSQQMVADIRQPYGIPQSRDAGTGKQKEDEEDKKTDPAPKSRSGEDGISALKEKVEKLEEVLKETEGRLKNANEQIASLEETLKKTGKGNSTGDLDLELMIKRLREITDQINMDNQGGP
ncbi:Fungal fucose-specific lectin [Penicillium occitanis (nom. inval.)]|nr:Fungal fucose-specific lectin [Penicillium occitanis (nom. inval.)]PCG97225.1 hypothetical protein PENOC_069100 [Penicillium occitanis (nom. inval.)]